LPACIQTSPRIEPSAAVCVAVVPRSCWGAVPQQRGESPPCFARWAAAALGTGGRQRGVSHPAALWVPLGGHPVQRGGDAGGALGRGKAAARQPWCFLPFNAPLSLRWLPKSRGGGELRLYSPGTTNARAAWVGSGVDRGSHQASCWTWAPLHASAFQLCLQLCHTAAIAVPSASSALLGAGKQRARVPFVIFPMTACHGGKGGPSVGLRDTGTQCGARGHGDPAVPKGHCQPPPAPSGSSRRPRSSRVPVGSRTHLNR